MYSSFSPHSSIWFFPPGLKDICSPPSQVITHLKQWPFLHPLNNPHHFENSAYVSNFPHLTLSHLPLIVTCISHLSISICFSRLYCCSLHYVVSWSVRCPSSFPSRDHVEQGLNRVDSRVEWTFSSFSGAKDTVNEWRLKDSGSGW